MERPIGIDLFAGAGGMSLGFEQAGFDVVAAVEIDPIHACIHKYNFPNCTVIPKSIVELTGADIRRSAQIGCRSVDVVFGGPPCQGFSLIGQRALEDPRNGLVNEFVRIISELDARYFVFENVKGITVGRHKQFLKEIIMALEAVGYSVRLPWKVLNASSFGVPQDRERLILMGAKKGVRLPEYPIPVTVAAGRSNGGLPPGPSCEDALADLPEAEHYSELLDVDEVQTGAWGEPSAYARKLRCLDNDAWGFGYPRRLQPGLLTASLRTAHSEISRRRFAETEGGCNEPISRFYKLPPHGVSNTLRAGTDSARGAFTSPRPIHYSAPRCVTVREMARLHGFPDWFRFHETKWHGARQVGNSVPPPLANAVARAVMKALEAHPSHPETILALHDPSLLRMDMSRASAYWGVQSLIGKRDRKSGSRKRKQDEIEAEHQAFGRGEMAKVSENQNRYKTLMEKVFLDRFEPGMTEIPFARSDIETTAKKLEIGLPKNLGDVVYSVRYRMSLPEVVLATQPEGKEWIIEGMGRALYAFKLVPVNRIVPNTDLVTIKIPDATPEIISSYALSDEQALLAKVRYNRLIDIFLGMASYSLQNHLRTTVQGVGQIEIDEIYVGIDCQGRQYVMPVQAKGGNDQLSVVQTRQDLLCCKEKFPSLICRAISAQFMADDIIALFELTVEDDQVKVVEERHYRLVPADMISGDDLASYIRRG